MLVRPHAPARPGSPSRPGRNPALDTMTAKRLDVAPATHRPILFLPVAKPAPAVPVRVALVGGYSPRRCGIATFTSDTRASLLDQDADVSIDVYAMTPHKDAILFDDEVCATISESDPASYVAAADLIARSHADLVWLQHEFGLFGGAAGAMILTLIDRISVPLIITLHTVLSDPDDDQLAVMKHLVARATRLVVMTERARLLLTNIYGASAEQIALIPHGVPDRPFGRSPEFKVKLGLAGHKLLMTFGLLSPGKGIETVIAALPAIIAAHPEALYCIVGATHPTLVARDGEAYRDRLHALARTLGVEGHIRWINAFVETGELLDFIEAADIFVTPYPGAAQSTSGTLSYALALGKAVVSTPYLHAAELLADDHGIIVPFNDSVAIAREIIALLDAPDRLLALQKRAYAKGRDMIWPEFAARCLDVIRETNVTAPAPAAHDLIGISGLLRLCDDTGILQHSIFGVPDRAHGYCVDDNARALMLMNRLSERAEPHRSQLAGIFAAFVQSAWNPARGEYRNFMGYRRDWLEEVGSQDSCGRTLWALGATIKESENASLRYWARGLFDESGTSALGFGSPRATAFAMLGADYLLAVDASHDLANLIVAEGAERLLALFHASRTGDWPWFETRLAYDNARLCEAMIRAGLRLARIDIIDCGITSLEWLMAIQTTPAGHFRPIGSDNFGVDFERGHSFDQQPVEIWAAIDAAAAAHGATGKAYWLDYASLAYGWFDGLNDRGLAVGDPLRGSCYDGLNPRGVNLNEGAESVLSYQLASCALRKLTHD